MRVGLICCEAARKKQVIEHILSITGWSAAHQVDVEAPSLPQLSSDEVTFKSAEAA